MMKHTTQRGVLMLLLLLLAAACSTRPPAVPGEDGAEEPARLTVMNRSMERVTMYVSRGAERIRLGTVHPGGEETFRIPSAILAGWPRLRFTAETAGRMVLASTTETVTPGIHLEMLVQ